MRRVCHRMFQNVPSTQLKYAWKHNWHYELWSWQSDEKAHCSFKLPKFSFFYVMYFLALILIALLPKGKKKNKWHVGTTHGFAGFGLSKTVYFSGGEKKKSLPFATVQPEQLNCRGTEGKRSRIAAEPTQAALQAASGYWPAVRNWNGTESGPSSEFTETVVSAIFFFFLHTWLVCFERLERRWRTMCLYQACLMLVRT